MNDLGLTLHNFRGRPQSAQVAFTVLRELGPEDYEAAKGRVAPERQDWKRMSERHHAVARMLAIGLTDDEAAATVGYTVETVRMLKASPAFQELQALYREKKDTEFAEFSAQLAGLGKDAILELRQRLEDDPDKVPTGMLGDLVMRVADRTGHGPATSTNVNVNVNLGQRLEAARLRARQTALRDITPPESPA